MAAPSRDPLPDDASRGYQSDSAGYSSSTGDGPVDAGPDRESDIFLAALAKAEERRRRRAARRAPKLWLPGSADLDHASANDEPEQAFARDVYGTRSCQLGLRLRPNQFERLGRAAEIYGIRPTTLARMMVLRGVDAVLEAELVHRKELLGDREER